MSEMLADLMESDVSYQVHTGALMKHGNALWTAHGM